LALTPGTRLGVYEITSLLGEGGMGQVYRATDTSLKRQVALKVLPAAVAADADRLARFQREAEVLAALNHPHIAAIYGLERAGGATALVMELVEGEDLSQRIAKGAIAADDALPIARQIAEALDAAHEQGIIHRDLKPANIKVRADGTVKVLDFGLAKALAPAGALSPDAMSSPTITSAAMTQAGMILGTAAYMSPEQARGKTVDRRTDIWAFGVVLYEMLAGQRAFPGDDVSITLANVMKDNVAWDALPKDLAEPIRRLLRRCLEKDPRRRLSAIADARLELDEGATASDGASTGAAHPAIARRERWMWASVAALAVMTALAFALRPATAPEAAAPTFRFGILPPEGAELATVPRMAIAPDGRSLVFTASRSDSSSPLWLRRLDSMEATPVEGSEGAAFPFWSPDGRQVAFFMESPRSATLTQLRIVDLQGGTARTLVDDIPSLDAGGSWNAEGLLLVASRGTKGILKRSASGGQLTPVTTLDPANGEVLHLYPQFLPDGRHFIYQAQTSARDDWTFFVGSIDSADRRKLVQSDYARFAAPNLLVYTQGRNLVAQAMDPGTLALTGQPLVIAADIASVPVNGRAAFSVSDTGVLVYRSSPERQGPIERTLTWLDRGGKVLQTVGPPVTSASVRLSPDGARVALLESSDSLWVADLARDVKTPIVPSAAVASPTWSADGTRLLFGLGTGTDQSALAERDAGSATQMKTLHQEHGVSLVLPFGETSDGALVVFGRVIGGAQRGIGLLSKADGKVTAYLENSYTGTQAALSPDGRWLAYTSSESGASQVMVQPFPNPSGGKWAISTNGGSAPRWRRDGRELFYVDAERRLMSVPVTAGSSFVPARATALFSLPSGVGRAQGGAYVYDAAADGQRFLVSLAPDDASVRALAAPLTVVTNWTSLLKDLKR
jgi:dipeptidyl aminopeptidase/acylaminoacyl peptidase